MPNILLFGVKNASISYKRPPAPEAERRMQGTLCSGRSDTSRFRGMVPHLQAFSRRQGKGGYLGRRHHNDPAGFFAPPKARPGAVMPVVSRKAS